MSGLLDPFLKLSPLAYQTCWISPSNIAFIKYWGKKAYQLPANPSLSLTLKECISRTSVAFVPHESLKVEFFLDGKERPTFGKKIDEFLKTLAADIPLLNNLSLKIESKNTFPHGAGIASSASGLSAFALCFTEYLHHLIQEKDEALFLRRASFISRLASGSACRSVYGGFTTWGESSLKDSSDKYASPLKVHHELEHLQDTILVIDDQEKSVSSRQGHERMKEHFFSESRFAQAKFNFDCILPALKSGDMEVVGEILEAEAFSLHAMMLTSPKPFLLMKPNTLAAIELIQSFRKETKLPLYFTLDAGPNLHLIYPQVFKPKIHTFINHELAPMVQSIIFDERGEGPIRC
jgi:diphosphomevalonate decarboxylase